MGSLGSGACTPFVWTPNHQFLAYQAHPAHPAITRFIWSPSWYHFLEKQNKNPKGFANLFCNSPTPPLPFLILSAKTIHPMHSVLWPAKISLLRS